MENIRNFVIIAHIDHGKSTLADRFLELTGTVESRQMKAQYLDQLELERERGITIKMAPVRMVYHPDRGLHGQEADNADSAGKDKLLYSDLTYKIRGIFFSVRKNIGLGHKENVYQNVLEQEFKKNNLIFKKEITLDVFHEGKKVGVYRPDFIIEDKIILEIKSLPFIGKREKIQIQTYLKGSNYKLGILVNFGGKDVEIERVVYDEARNKNIPRSPLKSAESAYILNLIDTPGHPDFSYEVSRALAAVEGAILLVDATQGIQAQTLAHFEVAKKSGLKIIGAVNKIDLKPLQLESVVKETAVLIGCRPEEIFRISAKTGEGVKELLEAVIKYVPAPIKNEGVSRALIFDSLYDEHKGVIAFVRVFSTKGGFAVGGEGEYKSGQNTKLIATNENFKIKEVGCFFPELKPVEKLTAGEMGYIATGFKDPDKLKIGDTIGDKVLPGYSEPRPVVFVSFYPDGDEYDELKKSFQKLKLQDSALKIDPDFNEVLGRGFKVGFLGKLHFEITAERLEQEFGISTVNTFPSVAYKIKNMIVENVENLPDDFSAKGGEIWEPMINVEIISPLKYLGNILQLKELFRMENIETQNLGERIIIKVKMPLAELISDFDDNLKSISEGFASFSYELGDYKKSDLEKLEFLAAGAKIPGLTRIVPKKTMEHTARKMVERLKEILPRQQFAQAVQARAGGRIVARENIPAFKKDVTGYLYGGDRTRKMKLWKKQKRGKKKLLEMATTAGARSGIRIPAEAFKKMLK